MGILKYKIITAVIPKNMIENILDREKYNKLITNTEGGSIS